MAGKGSAPRKGQYGDNFVKFSENYDRIFKSKHEAPLGGSRTPSKSDQKGNLPNPTGSS